jgi:hypothetical protein
LFNNGGRLADDSTFTFAGTSWLFNYSDTGAGTKYACELASSSSVTMTFVPEPQAAQLGGLGMFAPPAPPSVLNHFPE